MAAHAWTGGLTSPNAHSYAGICPLGCMYHSRVSRMSWLFAKSGSIIAKGIVWNAMSHAANHGYSHLSGSDKTSAADMCHQLWLRPFQRDAGGAGSAGSPSSQRSTM